MEQFSFDVGQGNSSLAMFGLSQSLGTTRLAGTKLQSGSMAALFQAEWLAAQAKVVPFVVLPDGRKGLVQVGAARARINDAATPESVRTLYLATHGSVRLAHAYARDVNASSDPEHVELLTSRPIGVVPLAVIVALTVTGIAAVCAGAWYAKEATQKVVETRGEYLRSTYAVDQASALATASLAAGKAIPDGVWSVFREAAQQEHVEQSIVPFVVAGAAAGALALSLYLSGGRRAAAP